MTAADEIRIEPWGPDPVRRDDLLRDLARDRGEPSLAREVGVANARNPIAIVVPCQ